MATGFVAVRQVRMIGIISVKATPKEPLARATKVNRSISGYRTTNGNIAAIDFGTTSVSVAFTTDGDKDVNTLVLDESSLDTRIPNTLLLKRSENGTISIISLGNDATTVYSKLRASDRCNYIYFERIKMLMKRDKVIDRQSLAESFSGESFYLVEVIGFILKYLRDRLIEHLSKTPKPLKTTDFNWVITVPAIWDARGKRMMREAAYLGGLLSGKQGISHFTSVGNSLPRPLETNPDKLSLALEPEVAAIYSQIVTSKEVIEAGSSMFEKPNGAYMVLDIGGGTVDITAQVEVDGGVEVLSIPTGNTWGGTQVNEKFSELLQVVVSDPNFSRFISSGDKAYNQTILNKLLYKEFELQKMIFGDNKIHLDEICIDLPTDLIRFYSSETIEKGAKQIDGVEFSNDCLYISCNIVKERLFGPVIDAIVECMLEILDSLDSQIDTFYLVGGFGGCKYLYNTLGDAIKTKFGSTKCRIIVPTSPKLAIATGAVMWRRDPDLIKARRVDATYGISLQYNFDESKHDSHYRIYNPEQRRYKCSDVFTVYLQRGEIARANEVFVTTNIIPAYQTMTYMKFDIFTTPQLGVQYVKDRDGEMNVMKIGELVMEIPNPDNLPRELRKVDVTMDFSGTEIQAKAKYCVTGKEVKTVCDFLSAQQH